MRIHSIKSALSANSPFLASTISWTPSERTSSSHFLYWLGLVVLPDDRQPTMTRPPSVIVDWLVMLQGSIAVYVMFRRGHERGHQKLGGRSCLTRRCRHLWTRPSLSHWYHPLTSFIIALFRRHNLKLFIVRTSSTGRWFGFLAALFRRYRHYTSSANMGRA